MSAHPVRPITKRRDANSAQVTQRRSGHESLKKIDESIKGVNRMSNKVHHFASLPLSMERFFNFGSP
jgi:hypothetical protein